MVKFKVFSKFFNIFGRFNPLNLFDFGESDSDVVKPPSSDELLKMDNNQIF